MQHYLGEERGYVEAALVQDYLQIVVVRLVGGRHVPQFRHRSGHLGEHEPVGGMMPFELVGECALYALLDSFHLLRLVEIASVCNCMAYIRHCTSSHHFKMMIIVSNNRIQLNQGTIFNGISLE